MKIITSWQTLMTKAKALGNARKHGDIDAIRKAEADLKSYEKICLQSDEIITGFTYGDLT